MIDIQRIVITVEALLAEGSRQSVTYAALECRLAIEKICYERLQVAHDYISHDDLRVWRPRDVVNKLIREVDENAASQLTLSIARQPSDSYEVPIERIPDAEWLKIGTQAGFDPKTLSGYWHSLSNLALHVRLPKSKDDDIPDYGDDRQIREKVVEVVNELKRLAKGTLLTTGIGEEVSFVCKCGRTNKRRSGLLTNGHVVSCVGFDCDESFDVTIEENEFHFGRRVIAFDCKCGDTLEVPTRVTETLKRDQFVGVQCLRCGEETRFIWRLMPTRRRATGAQEE